MTAALAALRRNLNRPVNMFDPSEAVEQLEALTKVARTTLHKKSDEYGAILDEVRDRQFALPPPALRRLLSALLGDPIRARIAKESSSILKDLNKELPDRQASSGVGWNQNQHGRHPYQPRCYTCGVLGHLARNCLDKPKDRK